MIIEEFLKLMNISTDNLDLYYDAFTHPSFSHEHNINSYDRLEFMGDSVFGIVVADLLYRKYPEKNSGKLTKERAALVKSESLSKFGKKINLDKVIRLGSGEAKANSQVSSKILEDVMESFVGAIYLDKGFYYAYEFVKKIVNKDLENYEEENTDDYKSKLQETIQADYHSNVVYKTILEEGTPQDKHFVIEVIFCDSILGRGEGKSKKIAEQEAAKQALERMVK